MFDTVHWLLDLYIQRAYVTLIAIEIDAIHSTQPTALDKAERMTLLYSGLSILNWSVWPFGRSAFSAYRYIMSALFQKSAISRFISHFLLNYRAKMHYFKSPSIYRT